jgi:alpha-L-fucosidase
MADGDVQISSLGLSSKTTPGKVQNVTVLGSEAKIKWNQGDDALHLELPRQAWGVNEYGAALRIALS